jgi:hypothetical protein
MTTSPTIQLRKQAVFVETIFHENGPPPAVPRRRAYAYAVIRNPYAGRYVEDIMPMMDELKPLGLALARLLVDALGGDPKVVEGYGKGAIIGIAGELEHGALWHAPGGYAMREILGDAKAIVPSTKKVGSAGAHIDIPITHINASYVRSHFDAIEVGVNDAPRPDEMMVILAMTTGPRVQNRAGGLAASAIKGEDGLR